MYEQIHAFVRRHLRQKYGEDVVPAKGPIPAHLLGNIKVKTQILNCLRKSSVRDSLYIPKVLKTFPIAESI